MISNTNSWDQATLTRFSFGTLSFGLSSGCQSFNAGFNPIPFEAIVFSQPLSCEKKILPTSQEMD